MISRQVSADVGAALRACRMRLHGRHRQRQHEPALDAASRLELRHARQRESVAHVTYGQYSGRYNEAQVGSNSPVGNSRTIYPCIQGPAGQGYGFASGLDIGELSDCLGNSQWPTPRRTSSWRRDEVAPHSRVLAVLRRQLFDGHGYAEVSYVGRKTGNLLDDVQD